MATAPLHSVLSHWSTLLEGVSASPLDFYSSVEEALNARQVPNVETERIEWNEAGALSAKRTYLRVSRGRHVYDICAAPFGTGFFVSSWLAPKELFGGLLVLVALPFALLLIGAIVIRIFGLLLGPPVFIFGLPIAYWAIAQVLSANDPTWDDPFVDMPLLGRFYERVFRQETYYSMDTTLMFQQSVHNAVMEAVNKLTEQKGVRGLSELERKPALHGLLRS